MGDETKRLSSLSRKTQKLQKETKRLSPETTQRLDDQTNKTFPIFLSEGEVVKERYKILSVLGQHSGESFVYLCDDSIEKRKAVLKLYHKGFTPKEEIVKNLVQVTHPDIINVFDFDYIEDQFFEVMEYAEGGSLLDRLQEKLFSEAEIIEYIIPEVLNALKFCHTNGIIHRDIKPANIFYRHKIKEDIVIGDFGISSKLEHGMTVKKTKGAMTLDYAAPELIGWEGNVYVGKELDYYAFGITLLQLLTGVTPFEGSTELQIITRHTSEKIPLPDGVSDKLKKLLSGLLIKERKKRWGVSEIERWLAGEEVPVYEDELKSKIHVAPYKFSSSSIANTPKELAMLIQTFEDREIVKKHFSKGWISNWLGTFDQENAYKVAELEEKVRDLDLALLETSCILDPGMPYFFAAGKTSETPEDIAVIVDKNWALGKKHIFSGMLSIWLKHSSYMDVYERLEQIRKEYEKDQDRGVEIFLQILGLPKPEFSITPTSLDLGNIESTINDFSKEIKLSHVSERGLLYGKVNLSEALDGVSVNTTNVLTDKKGDNHNKEDAYSTTKFKLWPGEKYEFNLSINAEKLKVNKKHTVSIVFKTAAIERILAVSFIVCCPPFSNRRAKKPLMLEGHKFYTLQEAATYLYEKCSDGNIDTKQFSIWVKYDLEEERIAQKISDIFTADKAFSEKCCKFLKLCGVFDEKKIIELFKKMRIAEFNKEQEIESIDIRNEIRRRFNDRREEARRDNARKFLRPALVIGLIVGIVLGLIYGFTTGELIDLLEKNL